MAAKAAREKQKQASRRMREARGRSAETVAVLWLRLRGYRILERRLKTPLGEIDIIAARRDVLAIVEVKSRVSRAAGLQALTPRQCRRIERAATWFLARGPGAAVGRHIRFDLIVVAPLRLPVHVANAWTPGEAAF